MAQKLKVDVPFTRPLAKKCICWKCPVQVDSDCIRANAEKMGDVDTTQFFQSNVVPGLYCSSGQASCPDIQTDRPCICGNCGVYQDYRLAEAQLTNHYCKNGKAR